MIPRVADAVVSLEEFIATYRRDCAESRVDYLEVDTDTPFDRLLQAYLLKRTRIG